MHLNLIIRLVVSLMEENMISFHHPSKSVEVSCNGAPNIDDGVSQPICLSSTSNHTEAEFHLRVFVYPGVVSPHSSLLEWPIKDGLNLSTFPVDFSDYFQINCKQNIAIYSASINKFGCISINLIAYICKKIDYFL